MKNLLNGFLSIGRWIDNQNPFLYTVIVVIIITFITVFMTIPIVAIIRSQDTSYEYFEVDNMDCVKIFYEGSLYVSCDWSSKD